MISHRLSRKKGMSAHKKTAKPKTVATKTDPRFARIAARLMTGGRVTQARMFGATGLQQNGKYFAMIYRGALVAKLPAGRVAALVKAGKGKPFDPGHGRVMKEWISIPPANSRLWGKIAEEARVFVTATR